MFGVSLREPGQILPSVGAAILRSLAIRAGAELRDDDPDVIGYRVDRLSVGSVSEMIASDRVGSSALIVSGGPNARDVPSDRAIVGYGESAWCRLLGIEQPKLEDIEPAYVQCSTHEVEASRGCINRCPFCADWGRARRWVKPVWAVKRDMLAAARSGAQQIVLTDLMLQRDDWREWLSAMGVGIPWYCSAAVRDFDVIDPTALAAAGCVECYIGTEALDSASLDAIGKMASDGGVDCIKRLCGVGIHVEFGILISSAIDLEATTEAILRLDGLDAEASVGPIFCAGTRLSRDLEPSPSLYAVAIERITAACSKAGVSMWRRDKGENDSNIHRPFY